MKYYLFYLKYDKSLYAFTSVKVYADIFLMQRNPECFKVKEVKLKGEQEKIFMYTNKLLMLNKYPYQTGIGPKDYVELVATAKEDDKITHEVEMIEQSVSEIFSIFNQWEIKDKYMDVISRMVDIYDNTGHILLDTFSLFIDVHRDTFFERPPIEKGNDLSIWSPQSDNVLLHNF